MLLENLSPVLAALHSLSEFDAAIIPSPTNQSYSSSSALSIAHPIGDTDLFLESPPVQGRSAGTGAVRSAEQSPVGPNVASVHDGGSAQVSGSWKWDGNDFVWIAEL
jgi:hypothetical protein